MYATLPDMIAAVGEDRMLRVADRDRSGVITADVVAGALLDASARIDSAIGRRYALPVTPVPGQLKALAIILAHYQLDLDPSDDLRKRYEDALKDLDKMSDGRLVLSGAQTALDDSGEIATGGSGASEPALQGFKSSLDMEGF